MSFTDCAKMKLKLVFVLLVFSVAIARSQVVEKSLFGVQTGFLGAWASHEWGFSHHWVLHTEFGLDGTLEGGVHSGNFPVFLPAINFEPRYYYNLPRRKVDRKDIWHNAGNFASLSIKWYPNWFSLSSQENVQVEDGVFIIPTWGIRRNINWHFYYELGAGAGIDFKDIDKFDGATIRPIYNIILRVGYKIF